MARSRFPALLAALALIASACGGTGPVAETTTTTTTISRPATTTPGDPATTLPGVGSEQSEATQERIDELMIEAQQIRGLEFLEPVADVGDGSRQVFAGLQ